MGYFSYHARAKGLIKSGHLVAARFVPNYKNIAPALVLFFDCHPPMPIREYRFVEYKELLDSLCINYTEQK